MEQWKFPPARLTLAFAAYAIGFLAALLTLGSLSDHIGRRGLIGSLIIQLISNVMFFVASNIGCVVAVGIVQALPAVQQRQPSPPRSSNWSRLTG